MPTLNWIGKDKVVNHHQDVPYRVLDYRYAHGEEDSGNMIIHGDNLDALKALLPKYEGRVKCVYIDPPYNTGNENWVYNDNVNDPKIRKWLGEVVGREGEDLSRHDKWLCMMYPRLKLLQQLLADDGAIFISIDNNEQANLRLICDEVFGSNNFLACFVWKSRAKPSNTGEAKYKPQNDAEYILCFKKRDNPKFAKVTSGKMRSYPHVDNDGNYRLQTILKSNRGESQRDTMRFSLGDYTPPITKRWQAGEGTIRELWKSNRITFQTGEPMLKYYEHEEAEETAPFYCHIPKEQSGSAEGGKKSLNQILGNQHGFDTIKPSELLEYIFTHSTNPNDIILDSFAGSGTTAHAVLSMNAQDNGNRRFILIEMEDYAKTITAERVSRVIDGYADKPGTGGGFNYYELGEPLPLTDGNLNESTPNEKIYEYIWFTETKTAYTPTNTDFYLGEQSGTAYYFYYIRDKITTLDADFLRCITNAATHYVIYADMCAIDEADLQRFNITFKKIPRDISKL